MKEENNFFDYFKDLEDPRIERTKLYSMSEILLLALCGVISGCKNFESIEDYGKAKIDFLRKYLPYKNGTPSDDTIRRFLRAIDPEQFSLCLLNWVRSIVKSYDGEVIAIDGKTLRGSKSDSQKAFHMISAYATDLRLILCQQKVADKSNEIDAIPELLKMLDIKGTTITIDAMGTQKSIAAQIINQGGDYLLALKGNQGNLFEEVETFFTLEQQNRFKDVPHDTHQTVEKGHGRIETRICTVSSDINWITNKDLWKGLKSIVCIESQREIKGKISFEKRYYITSLETSAEKIVRIARSHWQIENKVFWVLDMCFGEDQSKIRIKNAPATMSIIRHLALNLLRQAQSFFGTKSIIGLQRKAGWQDHVLEKILSGVNLR
jgi:predicted transposase YbfD/YdcC